MILSITRGHEKLGFRRIEAVKTKKNGPGGSCGPRRLTRPRWPLDPFDSGPFRPRFSIRRFSIGNRPNHFNGSIPLASVFTSVIKLSISPGPTALYSNYHYHRVER